MSTREFFIKRWEQELAAFGKVLRALPEGQLKYRPHERCTSAGALAWQLADEQKQICDLLDSGQVEIKVDTSPRKVTEIVAAWDKATEELRGKLNAVDEKKWSSEARLLVDGNVIWKDTMENMLWGYLFDMVHHRGQLTSYLRPMGGKVPAIYGPSADDHGM